MQIGVSVCATRFLVYLVIIVPVQIQIDKVKRCRLKFKLRGETSVEDVPDDLGEAESSWPH